jgi:hypothetical protein
MPSEKTVVFEVPYGGKSSLSEKISSYIRVGKKSKKGGISHTQKDKQLFSNSQEGDYPNSNNYATGTHSA